MLTFLQLPLLSINSLQAAYSEIPKLAQELPGKLLVTSHTLHVQFWYERWVQFTDNWTKNGNKIIHHSMVTLYIFIYKSNIMKKITELIMHISLQRWFTSEIIPSWNATEPINKFPWTVKLSKHNQSVIIKVQTNKELPITIDLELMDPEIEFNSCWHFSKWLFKSLIFQKPEHQLKHPY